MKSYSEPVEPRNVRDWPDAGDIRDLGLSSRHGKQKSASKRRVRRELKKARRRADLSALRDEMIDLSEY